MCPWQGGPGAHLPPTAQVHLQSTLGKELAHHVLHVTLRALFLLEASAFRPNPKLYNPKT